MTTGEKIVKLRKEAGYSQEAFSEIMGVSRQAVSKWENGTAQPTNENLQAICRLFGVSVSQLLDDGEIDADILNPEIKNDIEKIKQEKQTYKTVNYIYNAIHIAVLIILSIAVTSQSIVVNNLKKDITKIQQQAEDKFNYLDNRINNLPSSYSYGLNVDSSGVADSDIKVLDYNIGTNTADIKVTFIPQDYNRTDTAKVIVKTQDDSYEFDAPLTNGVFTAITNVECTGDITFYFYITDGDKTRSFSIGTIENPAHRFSIDIEKCEYNGDIEADGKTIDIKGMLSVRVRYGAKTYIGEIHTYPIKACVEIYAKNNFVKSLPHEEMMDKEFGAREENDEIRPVAIGGRIYFNIKIDEKIVSRNNANENDISIVYVVVDNNGREYRCPATLVIK